MLSFFWYFFLGKFFLGGKFPVNGAAQQLVVGGSAAGSGEVLQKVTNARSPPSLKSW